MLRSRSSVLGVILIVTGCSETIPQRSDPISQQSVDERIHHGGETFHAANCEWCHGKAGAGGQAPNLVERVKTISKAEFVDAVTNGHNDMPAWKGDNRVMQDIDNIYAYLKAQSEGRSGEIPARSP